MKKDSSKNRKKRPPQGAKQKVQRQQAPQARRTYPIKGNLYQIDSAYAQARGERGDGKALPQRVKPKTRKRTRRVRVNRVLPMFVFIAIAIYLFGQMITMSARRSDIDVETVGYGGVDTPQRYTGLIVRDEYVVSSDRTGQPFYQFAEGEYVSKNAVVCTVKDTSSTTDIEDKLDKLDKDILKNQKSRSDLSAFSEDVARIEDKIQQVVDSNAGKTLKTDLSYLYDMKEQVQSFMTQRNEIWFTESVESLSQLTEEKSQYEQKLAQNLSSIRAKESGVLTFCYDGLEETLSHDTLDGIKKAQVGDSKTTYISKASTVSEGDPLFKIVTSNQWYIVAFLPNSEVVNWEKGENKTLNLQLDDDVIKINTKIELLEAGEQETKIVFSSYEQMDSFISERVLEFYLEETTIEGLKVPNDAIVEKSLLRVPKDCITESMGNKGVLLVNGGNAKFLPVSIVSYDDENEYIDQSGQLKLGDVILQGTGESAVQYKVSDLTPKAGVYVANSSMAKFVSIDILDQNQEYAIIRSGTTYGLQAYDLIVSDAKNITEGQDLY
ncbi:HlyD family efflux transporter periplasmic adaptor subunit [Anaerotignum sp.]|uniref:HlyD family efflux transporter periplasmic adaptor subunit n=1 Tax=Anaerotignum sp. TaxID=2039241 RepID=UPI002714AB6D|nr:HlyD family efflux transporter periplasmic adaptor subunit [Anaerotignum sp.]